MSSAALELIDTIVWPRFEKHPINLGRKNAVNVARALNGIKRGLAPRGWEFQRSVIRNTFLRASLEFTIDRPEEHLIVGFGYRRGLTTDIAWLYRVVGGEVRVDVPPYLQREIECHLRSAGDAEVVLFHNHPDIDDETGFNALLSVLTGEIPLASVTDRMHALHTLSLLKRLAGGGRLRFFLGENGQVAEFEIPPLLTLLARARGLSTG